MRSTGLSAVVWLWAALAVAEAPRAPEKMCDPLVALCYRPAEVRFEEFPRTPAVPKAVGPGTRWIFASARDGDATVYAVSGFDKHYADCGAPDGKCPYELVPGFGAVVRVSGRKAKVLGTPDVVLHPAPDDAGALGPEVVRALWTDAAKRFVAAFGGAPALQAALVAQHVDLADSAPAFIAALREAGVAPAPGH